MAKHTALDIANVFIQLANSLPNDSIDNLKVNKLCFFAQGWSLAKTGNPLFDEEIQAWDYGPVVPSVYQAYKCYGKDPINKPSYEFDESLLSNDEISLLTDVYMEYGKYTSAALINMTHRKDTPWKEAYKPLLNKEITINSMKEYFSINGNMPNYKLNITPDNISYGMYDYEE